MANLKFYGYSDDIFVCEHSMHGGDEKDINEDGVATYVVRSMTGGALLTGRYNEGGCWEIGIAPIDEDTKLPIDWDVSITRSEKGYSFCVEIETNGDAVTIK
jgi:hypothetical protein